jgi:hypothetical protein
MVPDSSQMRPQSLRSQSLRPFSLHLSVLFVCSFSPLFFLPECVASILGPTPMKGYETGVSNRAKPQMDQSKVETGGIVRKNELLEIQIMIPHFFFVGYRWSLLNRKPTAGALTPTLR